MGSLATANPGMDKNQALDAVFNLNSVAIVGVAKGDEFNTGRLFLNNIIEYGFKGQIHLVNPKGGEVLGIKIHSRLEEVPGSIDYVISCIRAPLVPQSLITNCGWLRALELQRGCSDAGMPVHHSMMTAARTVERYIACQEGLKRSVKSG